MNEDPNDAELINGDASRSSAEVLDAGDITGVGSDDPNTVTVRDPVRIANARAARRLAYTLITILAGTFIIHYAVTVVLVLRGQVPVEALTDLFDKWLPVITTYVGSAVTYFLTRER